MQGFFDYAIAEFLLFNGTLDTVMPTLVMITVNVQANWRNL